MIDTPSWYLIFFGAYNYFRNNGFFVYWTLVVLCVYQLYRFLRWSCCGDKPAKSIQGYRHMSQKVLQLYQEDFIDNHGRLAADEIEVERFVDDELGLEMELRFPKAKGSAGMFRMEKCRTAIVLTHPWSVLGGDMDNNVPETLAKVFAHAGYVTCRFNFRGVGKSKGRCTWRTNGERRDLLNVVDFMLKEDARFSIKRVLLVGYSYGSIVSNASPRFRKEIIGFVSISCPFNVIWFLSMCNCYELWKGMQTHKPKLFICGTRDDFISPRSFLNYFDQFPQVHRHAVTVKDANHGWFDKEVAVGGLILSWMRKQWEDDAVFQAADLASGGTRKSSKGTSSIRATSNVKQIPMDEEGGRDEVPEAVKKTQ
jgi:uncharacterized protein